MKQQRGFTLVELAIVLVIIGLILGMAFKGKDLIDGAKVKNLSASYNKISTAFNTYFEKYGYYPGDGCTVLVVVGNGVTTCPVAGRNGSLDTLVQANSALPLLQNTNILTAADLKTVFGSNWMVSVAGAAAGNYAANTNYIQPGDAAGVAADVDLRFICALDQQIDDGNPTTGIVRSSATNALATAVGTFYNAASDCWRITTTRTLGIKMLP